MPRRLENPVGSRSEVSLLSDDVGLRRASFSGVDAQILGLDLESHRMNGSHLEWNQ